MQEVMRGTWKAQLQGIKKFYRELQSKRDYDAALRQRETVSRRKGVKGAKTSKVA